MKKDLTAIEGIANISVTYDDSQYTFTEITLSAIEKQEAKGKSSELMIARVMTYFQVTDKNDPPKKQNKFDPPLIFEIKYSADDWKDALKNKKDKRFKRPRVAYLARKENNTKWVKKWVEFKKNEVTKITYPNPNGDPNGYLEITVKELPDPLIGGC